MFLRKQVDQGLAEGEWALFTWIASVCTFLFVVNASAGMVVDPVVLPDTDQVLKLELLNEKSIITETGCVISSNSVGVTDFRGLASDGEKIVQVLSVHFGICHLIFGRAFLAKEDAPTFGLLGNVYSHLEWKGQPTPSAASAPVVSYSQYGDEIQAQILNLVGLVQKNGMPSYKNLATLRALSTP